MNEGCSGLKIVGRPAVTRPAGSGMMPWRWVVGWVMEEVESCGEMVEWPDGGSDEWPVVSRFDG